jgi:hypothetical protein
VVDFKTDALRGRAPAELVGRYAAQREVYALAAAGTGDAPVRAVHLFLERASEPVVEDFAAAGLDAARERLEALIGEIRSGEFEPTREPSRTVCFACPAAARLCPRPAWRPRAPRGLPPEEPAAEPGPGGAVEAPGAGPAAGAPTQESLF